jgi:hypothetical protein
MCTFKRKALVDHTQNLKKIKINEKILYFYLSCQKLTKLNLSHYQKRIKIILPFNNFWHNLCQELI